MTASALAPWVIAPVILPAMAAALILLVMRHRLTLSRVTSLGVCAALLVMAAIMTVDALLLGLLLFNAKWPKRWKKNS